MDKNEFFKYLPFLLFLLVAIFWSELRDVNWRSFLQKDGVYSGAGRGNSGAPIVEEPFFGAVAVSGLTLAWGSSVDYTSKWRAKSDAIRRCAEGGAKDCRVSVWTREGCLALAISPRVIGGHNGSWGSYVDESLETAKAKALEICKKWQPDCEIVESFCSRNPEHKSE